MSSECVLYMFSMCVYSSSMSSHSVFFMFDVFLNVDPGVNMCVLRFSRMMCVVCRFSRMMYVVCVGSPGCCMLCVSVLQGDVCCVSFLQDDVCCVSVL